MQSNSCVCRNQFEEDISSANTGASVLDVIKRETVQCFNFSRTILITPTQARNAKELIGNLVAISPLFCLIMKITFPNCYFGPVSSSLPQWNLHFQKSSCKLKM